jgi:hypothetical protein
VSNVVFNIARGAIAEKFRDGAANGIIMLLKAADADAALMDYDTVALMLAGTPDEADFTNYARKTGLTGTITVDDTNDRVDVDIPDQTWTAAGGAANNTLVKLVIAYQESADDTGRIPLTAHDFSVVTDGSDLTAQINSAGFVRIT